MSAAEPVTRPGPFMRVGREARRLPNPAWSATMDSAVGLVQAYLYVNGYFTVTEYPVLEAMRRGEIRTATDVDILAVRFPGAGRVIPRKGGGDRIEFDLTEPDEVLKPSRDRIDMIIGEVKEGTAELNHGARDPAVLRAVLQRFGAVAADHSKDLVNDLLRKGKARSPGGHQIRLMAFGAKQPETTSGHFTVITLGHILEFFRQQVEDHWPVVRQMQFKDPTLGLLSVMIKAWRAEH